MAVEELSIATILGFTAKLPIGMQQAFIKHLDAFQMVTIALRSLTQEMAVLPFAPQLAMDTARGD